MRGLLLWTSSHDTDLILTAIDMQSSNDITQHPHYGIGNSLRRTLCVAVPSMQGHRGANASISLAILVQSLYLNTSTDGQSRL